MIRSIRVDHADFCKWLLKLIYSCPNYGLQSNMTIFPLILALFYSVVNKIIMVREDINVHLLQDEKE